MLDTRLALTGAVGVLLAGMALLTTGVIGGDEGGGTGSERLVAPAVNLRINAGGPAYVDTRGLTWAADSGSEGGRPTEADPAPVAGTEEQALFQQARVGATAYHLKVPTDGTYRVTLSAQENFHTEPGQRVFSATAEGVSVFTDLDLVGAVGPATAYTATADALVTDGVLDIAFTATVDRSTVSAIEVELLPEDD